MNWRFVRLVTKIPFFHYASYVVIGVPLLAELFNQVHPYFPHTRFPHLLIFGFAAGVMFVFSEVVYHLAFLDASLQRFQELLGLTFDPASRLKRSAGFVALLARQNRARESVTDLLRQNWRLLTRKMVWSSGIRSIGLTSP